MYVLYASPLSMYVVLLLRGTFRRSFPDSKVRSDCQAVRLSGYIGKYVHNVFDGDAT